MSGKRQAASGKRRNYRELAVFAKADALVLSVYVVTRDFPADERFGLTSQIRRAAVSVASNIVEGCSRKTDADFARFLEIAHGSCDELAYQLTIAARLNFDSYGHGIEGQCVTVSHQAEEVSRMLSGLLSSLAACRLPLAAEASR